VNPGDQSPSVLHILALYAFGILGGSIYGTLSLFTFALTWYRAPEAFVVSACVGGAIGGVAGIVSLLWVMYCLVESNLLRSIPTVFVITAIVAVASGPFWFAPLLTVPIANIAACVYSYRRYNSVKWRRRRNVCIPASTTCGGLQLGDVQNVGCSGDT
jgi:hypothetical protein